MRRPTKLVPGRRASFRHPVTGTLLFGTILNVNDEFDDVDIVTSDKVWDDPSRSCSAALYRIQTQGVTLA